MPGAPPAGEGADAEAHLAGAAPVEPDEVEASDRNRCPSVPGELARCEREPGSRGDAGSGQGEDGCGKKRPHRGVVCERGRGSSAPQGKLAPADRIFTTVKGPFLRALFGSLAAALAVPVLAFASSPAKTRVLAIHFDLEVNPVTSSYLDHQLSRAQDDHYNAAVIILDTPGGLSESMRTIVKHELASKIPVIVYVSPPGARAASAGVWITEAADIAAMAPQTNIGSSTPIDGSGQNLGSDLRRKVINDAVASLKSLMRYHHRNVAWADSAVRKAENVDDQEARKLNVVDVLAPTLPALLNKIDGRKTIGKNLV